jgi:hypothetical protein
MTAFLAFTAAGVALCILAVELAEDLQRPRAKANPFSPVSSRKSGAQARRRRTKPPR